MMMSLRLRVHQTNGLELRQLLHLNRKNRKQKAKECHRKSLQQVLKLMHQILQGLRMQAETQCQSRRQGMLQEQKH